jgi:hypothetical protein
MARTQWAETTDPIQEDEGLTAPAFFKVVGQPRKGRPGAVKKSDKGLMKWFVKEGREK